MRIVVVHNRYREPGGEDRVFEREALLLESGGHAVCRLAFENDSIDERSIRGRWRVTRDAIWSRAAASRISHIADEFHADVVHFHNMFPRISAAGFSAARATGAAVVQTLHNFRPVCPNALLFRDGRPCADCVGKSLQWPAIVHSCYRGSAAQSAVVALSNSVTSILHARQRHVDLFLALSESGRTKLVEGGIPSHLLATKPNFVADPGPPGPPAEPNHVLYVGRLSEQKGVAEILRAAEIAPGVRGRIYLAGDGPLRRHVEDAHERGLVVYLGVLQDADVVEARRCAIAALFPSRLHEMMPLSILESFAAARAVIATDAGACRELVESGKTGTLLPTSSAEEIAKAVSSAITNPTATLDCGRAAREVYTERYSADVSLQRLEHLYLRAIRARWPARASATAGRH